MTLSRDALRLSNVPVGVRVAAADGAEYLERHWTGRVEEARRAGEEHGRIQALGELAQLIDSAVEACSATAERLGEDFSRRTGGLAVEIAAQVLRREIDAERYDLEGMVRQALAVAATGRAPAVIRVSPKDAERLTKVPFRSGTTVEADPAMIPGNVHVVCARGVVVREVDEILSHVRAALLGEASA